MSDGTEIIESPQANSDAPRNEEGRSERPAVATSAENAPTNPDTEQLKAELATALVTIGEINAQLEKINTPAVGAGGGVRAATPVDLSKMSPQEKFNYALDKGL